MTALFDFRKSLKAVTEFCYEARPVRPLMTYRRPGEQLMLRFQSPRLKRKIILLCQLSCGFSVVTELLFAQGRPAQEETRQVITGTVTQAGTPLAGARVAISPGPGTTTDADGHFSFPGLMARRYRVSTWSN